MDRVTRCFYRQIVAEISFPKASLFSHFNHDRRLLCEFFKSRHLTLITGQWRRQRNSFRGVADNGEQINGTLKHLPISFSRKIYSYNNIHSPAHNKCLIIGLRADYWLVANVNLSPMNKNNRCMKIWTHESHYPAPLKALFSKTKKFEWKKTYAEFCEVNRTMVTRCGQCQISLFIFMAGVGK